MASKVDFFTAYKPVRNRWRRYRRDSIVFELLQLLGEPVANSLDDLRRAPWEALLLLKWILQDKQATDRGLPPISRPELDRLRQSVHDIPEQIELVAEDGPALILFRQLLNAQMQFQRQPTKGILRETALIGTLPQQHPIRLLFQARTGLADQVFGDLLLATFSTVVVRNQRALAPRWFDTFRRAYGTEVVDAFLSSVSRDYEELIEFCRSLPGADRRRTSELYEFPVVRRYPFLRTASGIQCWHPMVFLRGMEGFVHDIISESGQSYFEQLSRLFERHVVAEARRSGHDCLAEDELSRMLGAERQVPDALIQLPDANVFVEAKAGMFDESVMVVGNSEILAHKTHAIRKAIRQGWSASESLRETLIAPMQAKRVKADYLLVVTNKELNASNGSNLSSLYPDGRLEYPSETAERYLPLERIYIVSIEDFERLISAVSSDQLDLGAFLRGCVERDRSPETAVYHFQQHLNHANVKLGFSPLVQRAIDASTERITLALEST